MYFTRSLAIFEELGDPIRSSRALLHLGTVSMARGNRAKAQEFLVKALMLSRQSGELGRLAQRQGDYARARALYEESLTLCLQLSQQGFSAYTPEAFACLAAEQGQAERAASLFGAADAYLVAVEARTDMTRALVAPHLRAEHDRLVAAARTQLGEDSFAAAWAAGGAPWSWSKPSPMRWNPSG